ncbi:MAG TPA: DUF4388 domain-containing protein [Acidimicrobiia bacterium]
MDGQNLSGQLSDWTVNELLQIMQVTKKTGSLTIEGDRRGRIHFKSGSVTGADLTGSRQTYIAEDRDAIADVLYVLSSLDKGTFAMGANDAPDRDGWAVEEILADVESLSELESAVAESGLIEATGVRVKDHLDAPIELEPGDWQVLASLVQPFTFAHLESRFGRGGAVRALHTLHRLEVAEAIKSEDESQFLDKLAEGISADSSEPTWLESKKPAPEELVPVVELGVPVVEADVDEGAVPVVEDELADAEIEPAPTAVADSAEVEPVGDEGPKHRREPVAVRGVSADASTTLTDGVYDEIRRLRSKAAEK